jgi:hypothetical protein
MEGVSRTLDRRAVWLAWGAIAGSEDFNLGWLLAGAVRVAATRWPATTSATWEP